MCEAPNSSENENGGVNWTWHYDGYCKLKYWGFAIHACTDGETTFVIWLRVSYSNSAPEIV